MLKMLRAAAILLAVGFPLAAIAQPFTQRSGVYPLASPNALVGITPIVSASAEASHILKAAPGNLYSAYVTTGATAGYLMVFNATSVPADGAVTPVECVYVPATNTTAITFGAGPPDAYSVGIVVVFSSTGPFTKTGSATAFFKARVQ